MKCEPDTRWSIDANGRVQASRVWVEFVGREAYNAPGYRWEEFVHAEDQHVIDQIAAYLAARQAYVIAFRARHHSGRYRWIHAGGEPQPEGGYIGWTHVARCEVLPLVRAALSVGRAIGVCFLVA